MSNDRENIHVDFHNRARSVYFSAISEFENDAKDINRQKEEYRFVQLRERHMHSLKLHLEEIANALFQQHQHFRHLPELQQSLQQIIKDYLHSFVMKSRSI